MLPLSEHDCDSENIIDDVEVGVRVLDFDNSWERDDEDERVPLNDAVRASLAVELWLEVDVRLVVAETLLLAVELVVEVTVGLFVAVVLPVGVALGLSVGLGVTLAVTERLKYEHGLVSGADSFRLAHGVMMAPVLEKLMRTSALAAHSVPFPANQKCV